MRREGNQGGGRILGGEEALVRMMIAEGWTNSAKASLRKTEASQTSSRWRRAEVPAAICAIGIVPRCADSSVHRKRATWVGARRE